MISSALLFSEVKRVCILGCLEVKVIDQMISCASPLPKTLLCPEMAHYVSFSYSILTPAFIRHVFLKRYSGILLFKSILLGAFWDVMTNGRQPEVWVIANADGE